MTQRTKAALATQISTLLADNTSGDISESDVRSVFTDTKDSLVGGPASATDNALVRFDSTTGQLVQDSAIIVADTTGDMSGLGNITPTTGSALRSAVSAGNTLLLQAYDVDGAAYKTFATLTANNTPTLAITAPAGGTIAIDGAVIGANTAAAATVTTLAVGSTSTLSDDVTIANGKAIKTDTTTAHTLKLQAYDVDGTAFKTFATLTNANTPILDISAPAGGSVTIDGAVIGGVTPAAGSFTALSATGNATVSGYVLRSVGNALTAVGTTRADALQLAKEVNNITTAASGTGVILPAGSAGMRVTVFNAGANLIKVYGSGSDTIDTVAGSTGVALTNAKRCDYFCVAANTWISAQLGVISA